MEIAFKIPNGTMRVNADVFFREARIGKVRKILKLFRNYGPAPSQVEELKSWLREQMQEGEAWKRMSAKSYMNAKTRLTELEETYQRMQSPCYAVYTRDRERLKQAEKAVRNVRSDCQMYERSLRRAQKQEERYHGILDDVKRILEGGRNEGD